MAFKVSISCTCSHCLFLFLYYIYPDMFYYYYSIILTVKLQTTVNVQYKNYLFIANGHMCNNYFLCYFYIQLRDYIFWCFVICFFFFFAFLFGNLHFFAFLILSFVLFCLLCAALSFAKAAGNWISLRQSSQGINKGQLSLLLARFINGIIKDCIKHVCSLTGNVLLRNSAVPVAFVQVEGPDGYAIFYSFKGDITVLK